MATKIIKGGNYKYIGDIPESELPNNDLPDDVILNKVRTGCGLTYLALHNNVKYVIAMPYTSLIKNKLKSCTKDVIGVYDKSKGGKDFYDVIAFKGDKILVTYDSLDMVTSALKDRGDLEDWKILIDESHKLIDSGAFRGDAIKTVLDNYKRYRKFIFATATPMKDDHQLYALRSIPKVRIKWDNLQDVQIHHLFKQDNLIGTVAKFVTYFLDSKLKTPPKHKTPNQPLNAHVFINSVNNIISIIKILKANGYDRPNNIKIVCANRTKNTNKITKRLGSNYSISTVDDPVKRINFYTSSSFEGLDIKDQFGVPIIVSNSAQDFSKISIAITMPQIINRIRDTEFRNQAYFFYNKHKSFANITEAQYIKSIDDDYRIAKAEVKAFNQMPKGSKFEKTLLAVEDHAYIKSDGKNVWLKDSETAFKKYSFHITQSLYSFTENGIATGSKPFNGITYIYSPLKFYDSFESNKPKDEKFKFKDMLEQFKSLKDDPLTGGVIDLLREPEIQRLLKKDKYLDIAYTLDTKKLKALKYSKTAIKNYKRKNAKWEKAYPTIAKRLNIITDFISNTDAKVKLTVIYIDLDLKIKANATHMSKYYKVVKSSRIINGEKVYGYNIEGTKYGKTILKVK